MKPIKAYILRIDAPLSKQYAKDCADSCEKVGVEWEYFDWFHDVDANHAWNTIGLKNKIIRRNSSNKAQLATSGHAAIWKKIADNKECAIILEHDAIMLHKIEIDIPDNQIVVLGYKLKNPSEYDHVNAGPPRRIFPILGHEGAHSYAITHVTAQSLIDEIEHKGVQGAIDNIYFLKMRKSKIPLSIMDPTPAMGWLRESTIWGSASARNYKFITSFDKNYKK